MPAGSSTAKCCVATLLLHLISATSSIVPSYECQEPKATVNLRLDVVISMMPCSRLVSSYACRVLQEEMHEAQSSAAAVTARLKRNQQHLLSISEKTSGLVAKSPFAWTPSEREATTPWRDLRPWQSRPRLEPGTVEAQLYEHHNRQRALSSYTIDRMLQDCPCWSVSAGRVHMKPRV